jgi:hypothetical protein
MKPAYTEERGTDLERYVEKQIHFFFWGAVDMERETEKKRKERSVIESTQEGFLTRNLFKISNLSDYLLHTK